MNARSPHIISLANTLSIVEIMSDPALDRDVEEEIVIVFGAGC